MNNLSKNFTILSINDNPDKQLPVYPILEKDGYEITHVSPTGCMEEAIAHRPDLIMSELEVLASGDFGLLRQLKSHAATYMIPVCALTGVSSQSLLPDAIRLGLAEWITSPYLPDEVLQRMDRLRETKRLTGAVSELSGLLENRGKFYAQLTRELRGPLEAVKILNQSILHTIDEEVVGEENYKLLLSMSQQSEEASLISDNLFHVSSGGYKSLPSEKQVFDINSTLYNLCNQYKPAAGLKNITFHTETLENLSIIYADLELLRLTFRNIFAYTIKSSRPDRTLEITTYASPAKGMIVEIRDNEKNDFTSFGSKDLSGTTLGNKIFERFLETHKGSIWSGTNDKGGSSLYISFFHEKG